MNQCIITKDLYSKDGILLLAEGQEITDDLAKKLELMGYKENLGEIINMKEESDQENIDETNTILYDIDLENIKLILNSIEDQQTKKVKSRIKKIEQNFKVKDLNRINSASLVVEDIIFNSKDQPWWMYINTLSNYIDWLYTHSIDVALISTMLATSLGLKNVKEITLGALLHDIGNLLIPKSIVQNLHNLTDEEAIYFKRHCELGKTMVMDANLSPVVHDIILHHHERMDGTGYPNALNGSQIPLHSQIVMVADTIDAMTTYRSYTPIMPIETVLDQLADMPQKYPKEIITTFSSYM